MARTIIFTPQSLRDSSSINRGALSLLIEFQFNKQIKRDFKF